jgi:diguanylate cyclase (GGDEF)-like protein
VVTAYSLKAAHHPADHGEVAEGAERGAGAPTSPRHPRNLRLTGVGRVWLLAATMLAVALVLYLTVVADLRGLKAPVHLPWWALAVGFFATESSVIRVRYRGQGQIIALNELPLVLGLFFAPPTELLLGLLLGSAAALIRRRRRQSPLQLAFNTSHFFLAGVVAVLVFDRVVVTDPLGPLGWSGALLATVIVTVVGHAAITAATVASGSRPEVDRLSQVLSFGVTSAITTTTVTLIAVGMVWRDQRSLLLLVVPCAMGALAYRGYMEHRSKSDTLDLIYESTRMLHRSPEVDSALVGLLTQARTIFRAERAEITLFAAGEEDQGVRTTLGPGAQVEAMVRVDVTPDELAFAARLPDAGAAFYPDAGQPVVAALSERGVREAMAVAVRRDGHVIGSIVVANRIGEANHFDHADLELFDALASNIAVVLENGTLEQSLQQLKELEAQLKHQAYHDPLTNLPNRSKFIERVELALEFASTAPERLAVLFFDLDDFKVVNDGRGHIVGDQLLIAVAKRIGEAVGPEDAVARLGGDEFAVLLDCPDPSVAVRMTEHVLTAIREPITINDEELQVRASAGIAMGDTGTWADELLRNADVAMYTAKNAGKNQWAMFSSDMHVAVIERHELMADLQRAVERDEFVLHYQPIVSLTTHRVVALEVLVRWRHPRRGLVQPGDFIPLAEETDLILPIGRLVLAKACAQAREWQAQFPEHADLAIAVNLSARQLQQANFVGDTIQVIAESGVSPESLILEITETELLEDTRTSITKLSQLKHLGLRLAMDDFGTGYSSLSFLADLPIDILKLAKPFTEGLGRSDRETAFAQAIIGLGKTVGMQIIAEGIERHDQADLLRALGSDMGQGYFFSPARDASYVEHLLRIGDAPEDRKIIPFPA